MTFLGRVHELLINSEKASTSPVFEVNVEILLITVFNNSHPRPFSIMSENEYFQVKNSSTSGLFLTD